MDPDKFQMRDMKRRILRLEKKLGYLKDDRKADLQATKVVLQDELEIFRIEVGVLLDEVYAKIATFHPPAPPVRVEGSLAARR